MGSTVIELATRRRLDSKALTMAQDVHQTLKEEEPMIRQPGPKPSREMLSVRIPAPLFHRLNIYLASARLNKQDVVEEVLTKHLDEVDPTGRAKTRALEQLAQPEDRVAQLERRLGDMQAMLEEALGKKRRRA